MKNENDPNVLFIVIDALRSRNLSCYGYPISISPNIDNLAEEGVLFEDCYSCSNVTDASLTTIFSGKYPMSHGILSHGQRVRRKDIRRLNELDIRFLPEILKSQGYTTLAVDFLGKWHKRGYDYYSEMLREANPVSFPFKKIDTSLNLLSRCYANFKKSTMIDEAQLVTAQAKLLIKRNRDKKFFLFIHYWDTHGPYAPPVRFYRKVISESTDNGILALLSRLRRGRHSRRVLKQKITRYLASIAYIDHEIGLIINALKNYGIQDQTLIVLTSDHGESLIEHGIYFGHHGLYDETIHVPLVLKYPTFPKKRVKGFIQHSDLVPTTLDFLGMEYDDFDGKSALPLIYGKTSQLHSAVYAEEAYYERKRAIRTRDYKYIYALSKKGAICQACRCIHGGIKELYDLNKDPKETHNIIEEKAELASRLEEKLSKITRT